jgi:serine protease Do
LGITVADLPERQKSRLQTEGSIYIAALGQAAAPSGLREGDIILRVNNTDIRNASQFQAMVSGLDRKKTVVFLIQRNDVIFFVPLKPSA